MAWIIALLAAVFVVLIRIALALNACLELLKRCCNQLDVIADRAQTQSTRLDAIETSSTTQITMLGEHLKQLQELKTVTTNLRWLPK